MMARYSFTDLEHQPARETKPRLLTGALEFLALATLLAAAIAWAWFGRGAGWW